MHLSKQIISATNCLQRYIRHLFVALPILFSFSSPAQRLILKNYQLKDGLPSAEVYCVFQDSRGFIWFGSDGGVSRFDGYTFKNFTIQDGLADNVVFGIQEDRHHRIWFRSHSGKLCYFQNDSIHRIGANDQIGRLMGNAIMTSLYIDSGDTLWCGLREGSGAFKIKPGYGSNDFQHVTLDCGFYLMEIENGNFISGNQLIGSEDTLSCNPANLLHLVSFYRKTNLRYLLDIPILRALGLSWYKFKSDSLWITDNNSLYTIQLRKDQPYISRRRSFDTRLLFLKGTGSFIWIGLASKGITRCSVDQPNFDSTLYRALSENSVSDVWIDTEGGIWFTTLENGVYYSPPNCMLSYGETRSDIIYLNHTIEKAGADNFLICNKAGNLDIVSHDGKVEKDQPINSSRVTQLMDQSPPLASILLTGNPLFYSTVETYLWTKKDKKFQPVRNSLNQRLAFRYVATADSGKTIYLFERSGVFQWNDKKKCADYLTTLPARTLTVYQGQNTIWLGCLNGLWSFRNGTFQDHRNESPYFESPIEDIKETENGTRYFATKGIGVIVGADGKYVQLTTENGLISNNCSCVYPDGKDSLWVGSKNGFCLMIKTSSNWRSSKVNIRNSELNYEVYQIEKIKNRLWLYTNKGLVSYDLNAAVGNVAPSIYLNKLLVNEKEVSSSPIQNLNYDQNRIGISFTGLSFGSLGKLTYMYQLSGLDTSWHTTQSTFLNYSFLPPGEYTFQIKAVSLNGVQSKSPATLHFRILKPYWKTPGFILISTVLILCMLYFLFTYRLRVQQRKKEETTRFNQQLMELEMKALRAQMNPHFIFNTINSIQNYIVRQESSTAQDYLAKLARLIRRVLENSKQDRISLEDELDALKLYVELEQLRAPDKFTFRLHLMEKLQADTLFIPPLILQPYVENAILHGLAPLTSRMGQLTVSIEQKDDKLICTIEDNGVGRQRADELRKKKQLFHKSMGLSVTEERVRMIGKLYSTESGICIEDKTDADGKPAGTRVTVRMNL